MKKFLVLLLCAVVLLVGYVVLDKSDIESSFGAEKACDAGEMLGCYNLGVMYMLGNEVEKDLGKAVQLFKKACDGGNMLGCTNLGSMYANGDGVEEDFSKAAKLLKKACDGGDMNGCRGLDIIYKLMAK